MRDGLWWTKGTRCRWNLGWPLYPHCSIYALSLWVYSSEESLVFYSVDSWCQNSKWGALTQEQKLRTMPQPAQEADAICCLVKSLGKSVVTTSWQHCEDPCWVTVDVAMGSDLSVKWEFIILCRDNFLVDRFLGRERLVVSTMKISCDLSYTFCKLH